MLVGVEILLRLVCRRAPLGQAGSRSLPREVSGQFLGDQGFTATYTGIQPGTRHKADAPPWAPLSGPV